MFVGIYVLRAEPGWRRLTPCAAGAARLRSPCEISRDLPGG
jgi:hypothetical protein